MILTADTAAQAIIASAKVFGADPLTLLDPGSRSRNRIAAAIALLRRGVAIGPVACRICRVSSPVQLSPSQWSKVGLTQDHVDRVLALFSVNEASLAPAAEPTPWSGPLTKDEKAVLSAIRSFYIDGCCSASPKAIGVVASLDASIVLAVLTALVAKGEIERLDGKRFRVLRDEPVCAPMVPVGKAPKAYDPDPQIAAPEEAPELEPAPLPYRPGVSTVSAMVTPYIPPVQRAVPESLLRDRILVALTNRTCTAQTLATLLDGKELTVCQVLNQLKHEGLVTADRSAGNNSRSIRWSLPTPEAAQ